jgi:hypothetical protein
MRLAFIFCLGRSGSYYTHSLLDSHPEILTIPAATTLRGFFHSTNKYWPEGGLPKHDKTYLVDAFIAENQAIFDARGGSHGLNFDGMGDDRNEYIYVDAERFRAELLSELADGELQPCRRDFFLAVHHAYARALFPEGNRSKTLIVYQLHNPLDEGGMDEAMLDFPNPVIIGVAHDPIRSLVSLLFMKEPDLLSDPSKLSEIVCNGTYIYCYRMIVAGWNKFRTTYPTVPFYVQALRALHDAPEESTRNLANWLGVEWHPSLMNSTFNGMKWNGDRWAILRDGKLSANADLPRQRADSVLSATDRWVIESLFRPTATACGLKLPGSLGPVALALLLLLPTKVERGAMMLMVRRMKLRKLASCIHFWVLRIRISYRALARSTF